jgi:transposase
MRHVALDLDTKTAFVTFIEDEPKNICQQRFGLDPIGLNSLKNSLRPDDFVVMEACPGARWLCEMLRPVVADVQFVNPIHFGKLLDFFQHKLDRNDSGLMCRLARVGELPTVWIPDLKTWEDREYASHRNALGQDRTRLRNRIYALLVEHGMGSNAEDLLKMDRHALFVAVKQHLPELAREKLASILRMLRLVEDELRNATATIVARCSDRQTARPEVIAIAASLPGVADWLAFVMASHIGDPRRFQRPGSLPNYAGLVPSLCSSGPGLPRHGHITKRGCAPLRWAAIEAANNARKVPGRFQNLYQRVYRRSRSHGKAIVACARELLQVLWHLLRKNESYRELSEEARLRKDKRRQKSTTEAVQILQDRPDCRESIMNHFTVLKDVLQGLASAS